MWPITTRLSPDKLASALDLRGREGVLEEVLAGGPRLAHLAQCVSARPWAPRCQIPLRGAESQVSQATT